MTLWYGSVTIQDAYQSKVGTAKTYSLYRADLVPSNPWNEGDMKAAKESGCLPSATTQASAVLVPATELVPRDTYPFSFWPPTPWDTEPSNDCSLAPEVSTKSISKKMKHRVLWMAMKPFMWPENDESMWIFARYLGAGSYGCAGMWCEVDEANKIKKVGFY